MDQLAIPWATRSARAGSRRRIWASGPGRRSATTTACWCS